MEFLQLFKSLLSRSIFLLHGCLSIYLIVQNNNEPKYWICSIPVLLLIVEAFFTLVVRKGNEFIYFWPSGCLYILTMIPIIWAIELELLEERIVTRDTELQTGTTSNYTTQITPGEVCSHLSVYSILVVLFNLVKLLTNQMKENIFGNF